MSSKRITRRYFLQASAALGAALLAACAPAQKTEPTQEPTPVPQPTPAPKEKVKISMTAFGVAYEDKLYTDFYIPNYQKVNPNVEVEFVKPQDYLNDIVRLAAAGEAPDVIRHWGAHLSLAVSGLLAPLDDLMAAANFDKDDFYASTWVGGTFKGKIYAVSQSPNFMGLWFNPQIFDEAGIPYPDNDYTIDKLMADAKALTKKDASGNVERYGYLEDWGGSVWFQVGTWVYSHGGRLLDDSGTKPVFDSPEVIQAFANIKALVKEGSAPATAALSGTGAIPWFVQGKAAMYGEGTHLASIGTSQAPAGFRYVGTTWPKAKVKADSGQDIGFVVAAGSKHKQEAFDYLAYMLNKENLLEYWQQTWVALPSRKSVFNDPAIKNIKGIPGFCPTLTRGEEEFKEKCQWMIDSYNLNMVNLGWHQAWQTKMNTVIQECVDKMVTPTVTADPEQACKEAQQKLLQIIQENPI
jgi:multiple sugar transport system substrate-binding protein